MDKSGHHVWIRVDMAICDDDVSENFLNFCAPPCAQIKTAVDQLKRSLQTKTTG